LPEDRMDQYGKFDVVLTQRMLINLNSVEEQHHVFENIMSLLNPEGVYIMIECSHEGLQEINTVREDLELELMTAPWHNLFFDEDVVKSWGTSNYRLKEVYPFASTYYFLSRIVYAKLAKDQGLELKYDSDINLLSTKLPVIGNFGATRLWLWEKR
jgi:hypothetical protein